ncbi:aldolase/citrate lyase family protein [Saccharopolyspora gloriosae]|uniref:aldolase/citrate lyase family protein n=1 Tax=Saccharopolyspora gloriosae TaxID=455344 RepID=UPI001FB57EB0|nr:aldolase/citrate lyase family protein [Saccharopolyspora gloriosae]
MLTRDRSTTARSFLFVPGHRPDRFDKAVASGADVVIVDLEDAVAEDDQVRARGHVSEWLERGNVALVRLNSFGTPWFEADLESDAARLPDHGPQGRFRRRARRPRTSHCRKVRPGGAGRDTPPDSNGPTSCAPRPESSASLQQHVRGSQPPACGLPKVRSKTRR